MLCIKKMTKKMQKRKGHYLHAPKKFHSTTLKFIQGNLIMNSLVTSVFYFSRKCVDFLRWMGIAGRASVCCSARFDAEWTVKNDLNSFTGFCRGPAGAGGAFDEIFVPEVVVVGREEQVSMRLR